MSSGNPHVPEENNANRNTKQDNFKEEKSSPQQQSAAAPAQEEEGDRGLCGFVENPTRDPGMGPGELVYSAKMDYVGLKCYYCSMCALFNMEYGARRTFIDVYTNRIEGNTPFPYFCGLCMADRTFMAYYDEWMFENKPVKAGCCSPIGRCDTSCKSRYGEAIVFHEWIGCPSRLGHYYGGYGPFCTFDTFVGLREGEADKLADIIFEQVTNYRNNGNVPLPLTTKPMS